MVSIVRRVAAGLVFVIAAAPVLAEHSKTDVVTLADGSTYIGEIKSVEYASLSLNTDPAGLLTIEWRHITSLISKFQYRIELTGGIRHLGTLGPPEQPGHLSIVSPSDTVEVNLAEVVQIVPISHGFWKGLDGSVNFGLTYSNESLQYTLSFDAERRTRRRYVSLSGQSLFNTQQNAENASQHSLKLLLAQVGKKQWGAFELGQLQSNPNQGFDLRTIVGGGTSRFFIETSRELLSLSLGAVYNRENVTDSSDVDDSAEALIGVAFHRFKRGSHSPSFQVSLLTFADMTNTSRFRAVFDFNIGWKIVGDLKLSVQVNNSYDSDPPGTDSDNNDLSLVTSVGYTF